MELPETLPGTKQAVWTLLKQALAEQQDNKEIINVLQSMLYQVTD